LDFDVVVVGAGPGGCVAARDLTKAGFKVALFDSDTRETLGKSILLDAEKLMFDVVNVPRPSPDEIPYHQVATRFFSGRGKELFLITDAHPSYASHLDKVVRRMLAETEKSGVQFFGSHRALKAVISGGKVRGVVFQNGDKEQEVRAKLVIDATGFNAALVRKLPPEMGIEFEEKPGDIVVAENHLCETMPGKAEEAVKNNLHRDEEVWNKLGAFGCYSTQYSHLSLKNRRAYILVGRKAEYGKPTPAEIIEQYKQKQGYFGKTLVAGKGNIRIRHSLDQLVADGFMVIGEAACMVIPAHGSGFSSAQYAGHLAAKAATTALKNNDASTAALWPYAREYQSGRGAILASYAVVRLVVDGLVPDQMANMMESGIMSKADVYSAFVPAIAKISPGTIPARIIGMARHRDLIKPIIKLARNTVAVTKLYPQYPATFDPAAFNAWKAKAKAIFDGLNIPK